MVVLFVVLTVILFVTIDYFVQKRKKVGFAASQLSAPLPLSHIFGLVPGGVFLQRSLTWTKIQDNGELLLGINPILLGLVGQPDEIVLQTESGSVEKGDTLIEIRKAGKSLEMKSPIKGEITQFNTELSTEVNWESTSQNWLYKFKPLNVNEEIPNWLIAESAQTWLKEKYQQIKEFFMQNLPQTELGPALADGGDLPTGLLSEFDENTWKKFSSEFIQK